MFAARNAISKQIASLAESGDSAERATLEHDLAVLTEAQDLGLRIHARRRRTHDQRAVEYSKAETDADRSYIVDYPFHHYDQYHPLFPRAGADLAVAALKVEEVRKFMASDDCKAAMSVLDLADQLIARRTGQPPRPRIAPIPILREKAPKAEKPAATAAAAKAEKSEKPAKAPKPASPAKPAPAPADKARAPPAALPPVHLATPRSTVRSLSEVLKQAALSAELLLGNADSEFNVRLSTSAKEASFAAYGAARAAGKSAYECREAGRAARDAVEQNEKDDEDDIFAENAASDAGSGDSIDDFFTSDVTGGVSLKGAEPLRHVNMEGDVTDRSGCKGIFGLETKKFAKAKPGTKPGAPGAKAKAAGAPGAKAKAAGAPGAKAKAAGAPGAKAKAAGPKIKAPRKPFVPKTGAPGAKPKEAAPAAPAAAAAAAEN